MDIKGRENEMSIKEGKHRVNVEKVVEQGKPQFFGVAGKCLSLDLQIGIHLQHFGLAGKCLVPCVSPCDDIMDIVKLPLTTYFTFLTRNAKICKNIPILMATRPLFQEFSDGKMSSILSPGIAKIFVVKPAMVKIFVVMAKTTGVNDYNRGNDDFAPPQKRAIGPFINWCCSPRNIFSKLTLKQECHIGW